MILSPEISSPKLGEVYHCYSKVSSLLELVVFSFVKNFVDLGDLQDLKN